MGLACVTSSCFLLGSSSHTANEELGGALPEFANGSPTGAAARGARGKEGREHAHL